MKNLQAILLLFLANTVSGIAQGISMLAIPWYFTMQNQLELFGLIYVGVNIASFFWVPYSGTLVDRFDRKKVFLVITFICTLMIGTIALFGHWKGDLPYVLVAAVFLITFLNYNIHYPTLYAFVQELTDKKYYGRIASYIEIQGQFTSLLAGAGGAFLLEGSVGNQISIMGLTLQIPPFNAWSIYEIFTLDGSTYLVAFIIILFIKYKPVIKRVIDKGSIKSRLLTGLRYLQGQPTIFIFGVSSYSVFVCVLVAGFYLDANYTKNILNEGGDVYAISEIFYGIGALFAGIAIRRIFSRWYISTSIIFLTLVTAVIFITMFFFASVPIFYFVLLLFGVANAGVRIQRVTYLFAHVPNELYGRTASIFFLTNIVFRISLLILFSITFFNTGKNVIWAFFILSVFLIISALVLFKYRRPINELKPFY